MGTEAIWVPLVAAAVGGAASSSGSKKAAKAARPQIPKEFRGTLGASLGLLDQGIAGKPNTFAAPLQPIQNQVLSQLGAMLSPNLSAGQGGLEDALRTIRGISETGLDPASVRGFQDMLAPFFDIQREQGVAGVREASAQRGGFFGSGSVGAEGDFLRRLAGEQTAQILPLALQSQALRLGAAQSIPGLITGTQESLINQLVNMFQVGEQARGAETQGLPIQGLQFLAALMGGTPFLQQAVPTNFLQSFGGNIGSLASSPGFLQFLLNSPGRGGTPSSTPGTFESTFPRGGTFPSGFGTR